MEDCIFCKIIKGEIPSEKIYENERVLAFLDIAPVNIGHTLVIPKEHYANIFETPEETLTEMLKVTKKVGIAIKTQMRADGVNININNDSAAGQIVFHLHIHIIPRLKDDGFSMWYGKRPYDDGEMSIVANKIIAGL